MAPVQSARENPRLNLPSYLQFEDAEKQEMGVVRALPGLGHIPFEFNAAQVAEYYAQARRVTGSSEGSHREVFWRSARREQRSITRQRTRLSDCVAALLKGEAMRKTIVVLMFLVSALVHAQGPQRAVAGRVLDPSGNAVAHATMTLRNALSGLARQAESDASGMYSFSGIEPGRIRSYRIGGGFCAETRSVEVKSDTSPANIDISLAVASVEQTVAVVSGSRVKSCSRIRRCLWMSRLSSA